MAGKTWKEIRAAIKLATDGEPSSWTVKPALPLVGPRVFDQHIAEDEPFGIYIIYAPTRHRGVDLGASRIQYIGRGDVIGRLLKKQDEKPGLWKMAHRRLLKFVAIDVDHVHGEFVVEGILLNEHTNKFGSLPKYNVTPGSKTLEGWRSVIRARPGPVGLLSRYGG